MKVTTHIKQLSMVLCQLSMLLLASCQQEGPLPGDKRVHIAASVGNGSFTRSNPLGDAAVAAAFSRGDAISVATGTDPMLIHTLGDDGKWSTGSGSFLLWEDEPQPTLFTAYYPVTDGTDALNFVLPTDQSDAGKIIKADYMTFIGEKTNPGDGYVSLVLQRRTARILVEIESFDATDFPSELSRTVSDFRIHSAATSYVAGTASGTGVAVTPYTDNGTTGGVGSVYKALVIPTDTGAAEAFISLTNAAGEAVAANGIPALEAGKSYAYKLKVTKSKLLFTEITDDFEGDYGAWE